MNNETEKEKEEKKEYLFINTFKMIWQLIKN